MSSSGVPNQALSASAGSGKTFRLALRYIHLLALGAKPESIVALTFSRKAAAEIFDRIMLRLITWITDPASMEREAPVQGIPVMTRDQLMGLLRSLIDTIHRLNIGTIDSFLVKVARAFPFECGIAGSFAIMDDVTRGQVRRSVMSTVLSDQAAADAQDQFATVFQTATLGKVEKSLFTKLESFIDQNHRTFLDTLHCPPWDSLEELRSAESGVHDKQYDTESSITMLRAALDRHPDMTKRKKWETFFEEAQSVSPQSTLIESHKFFHDNLLPALSSLSLGECAIKGYTRGKDRLSFTEKE